MNLSDLTARAIARFRDTSGVYTQEQWEGYVNDAYAEVIASRAYWPFLESRVTNLIVAAGTNTVELPANGWRVSAVYNATDDVALSPIGGQAEYNRAFPAANESPGTPQFYRLRANVLEVFPFADAATTLYVDVYLPPDELEGTDEPVFPAQYHRVLVAGALKLAYEDQGALKQAQLHGGNFDRWVNLMALDLLSTRHEGFAEVIDTF